jgi:hypothetical protein
MSHTNDAHALLERLDLDEAAMATWSSRQPPAGSRSSGRILAGRLRRFHKGTGQQLR